MTAHRALPALLALAWTLSSTAALADGPSPLLPLGVRSDEAPHAAVAPAPLGPVRVPRDLVLQAIRERDAMIAPDDRVGDPSYRARPAPARWRGPWPASVMGFGPNVRINAIEGPADNTEAEQSITAQGSKLAAGWNDGQYWIVQPGFSGFGYSIDGGATWTDGGGLPTATGTDAYYGDPVMASDPAGNFYMANLYRPVSSTWGIAVNHGSFVGPTLVWDLPVAIETSTTDDLDKPWITVDPSTGVVYCAYVRFFAAGGQQLEFSRSLDHGATWSTPAVMTVTGYTAAMSPRLVVGPNGELYLAYYEYDYTDSNEYLRIRVSLDAGQTFGAENDIGGRPFFNNYFSGPAGYNRERMVALVSLAVDRSAGPRRGTLYAVWQEMVNVNADPLGGAGVTPEVEDNGSAASATPFTPGTTLTGSLSSITDEDWWSFTGTAGQTAIFYLQPNGSSCNGYLRMFAGGGGTENRCAYSYFSYGIGIIAFTLPSSGTYYVRVLNADGVAGDIGNYVVYTGFHTPNALDIARDHRDVLISSSTDAVSWTAPRVVNDDPAHFDNAFPEVAVDGAGTVDVDWYDHRFDTANGILTDIYYSSSTDGGATFAPSAKVNDSAPVNWNLVATNSYPNMGDYNALIADGANVYADWTDGRGGTPDAYFAKLTGGVLGVAQAPVAVLDFAAPSPNPSRGVTTLRYSLPASGAARIELVDLAGRRIWQSRSADLPAGIHAMDWNGRTESGQRAEPGIYFARLSTVWGSRTQRIVRLR